MKRAFDLALTISGLILLCPVLLGLALTVRLVEGRPVLFRQTRVGQYGQEFSILKFRTMRVGEAGSAITVGSDNRITKLGAHLRRWKLDELPQLLNVLHGEMSLVGWRPELPEYVRKSSPLFEKLLKFPPGITDPASLQFKREAQLLEAAHDPEESYLTDVLPQKVHLSLEYAEGATLLSDMRVILRSIT